jgi:hypothetical protein
VADLKNQHTQGIKAVPQTLYDAYVLLDNWKDSKIKQLRHASIHDSVACVIINEKKHNANVSGDTNRK